MTRPAAFLAIALLQSSLCLAQISAPNAAGVAMGHLHYHVKDVEANKKFWISLGGEPAQLGATQMVRFPGVLVMLTQGEASAGSEGSVVSHVAFRVQSIAKLEAAGMKIDYLKEYPGVASAHTPEGERVELFDDQIATNMGFEFDTPANDPVADRHNHHITVPIVSHHIHLYIPQGKELEAKAWYARMFGGVAGKRWHYDAVDLPGINLNFSSAPSAVAPTRGRRLDHIGFEIANLEAFCRKLEAGGVKFDKPYVKSSGGIATVFLTDPWGTYIELTEGLRGR